MAFNVNKVSKFYLTKIKKKPLQMKLNPKPALEKMNNIYELERLRQIKAIGRIEKIEVIYEGLPEKQTLIMNKNISTPYNCAQHLSETLVNRSALALVDNKPWDMQRPLQSNCKLNFQHFGDPEPHFVNKAFWRTCSFLLGAVMTNSFKDNVQVTLHSFPSPQVRSGSFVYDMHLDLANWKPTDHELRVLSADMIKLCTQNIPIDRLEVKEDIASEIFEDNPSKSAQIPYISEQNNGNITLYRVGHHIDISRGPMVGNTSFVGRCSVTSVHKLESSENTLYRFQGVALPKSILLNHFAFRILEDRARKLNRARQPNPLISNDSQEAVLG